MSLQRPLNFFPSKQFQPSAMLLVLLLLALLHAPISGWSLVQEYGVIPGRVHLLRDEPVRRLYQLGNVSDSADFLERTFLSPAALQAAELIQGWMHEAGLETWIDDIGNVHGRYSGTNSFAPALLLGSHLDTVIDAGRYDGALGIVCAIAAVKTLAEEGKLHSYPRPIEIIAFSDEEGVRYQSTLLGSTAIAGTLRPELLNLVDKRGVKLEEALTSRSFPGTEESLARVQYDPRSVWGYVEVHIEQGPILEAHGLPLGTVGGISGQTRLRVIVKGTQGHAGTVPMRMRRDAMPAAAQGIVAIEQACQNTEWLTSGSTGVDNGDALVCTVGEISAWPGASNVIPGEVVFSVDIRAKDDSVREAVVTKIESDMHEICKNRGISCEVQQMHKASAIKCSVQLMERLREAASCALQEIPEFRNKILQEGPTSSVPLLMSGAGHDAMALSSLSQVGMLFVRCEGGISHSPAENVMEDDIWAASGALYHLLDAEIS